MTAPKVLTVVGTRPEIIRLSRIIPKLDERVDHILVHTGQNHDRQLNDVFFEDLGIRQPDHYLNVDTSSLGAVMAETIRKSETIFAEVEPDAVLILGDTNSAIAALVAKRMHIPTYHMEAGNRSFDENVPEETNRRMVDHVADFNLAYTEHARRNLLAEGLHPRRILVTGSPMKEVIDHYLPRIEGSDTLERLGVAPGEFFLVSAHRQENVDSPERLRELLDALAAVRERWGLPVLVSTHPRTRNRLEALPYFQALDGVHFHPPFGFFDYCQLQRSARCVLSDSGTISEESAILDFPAITIRDSMERPEALDAGAIVMSGLKADEVIAAIEEVTEESDIAREVPAEYLVGNSSQRVIRFLLSTMGRHHEWAGIRR
ncbi:O-antigen biosynthesis protein [Leifsonia xyli subsp. cynodontis DSM 46306]|uniref:UDP-N-acetylglucosamine 2-epimerase domain-containing protein n=1 Tax=Leifsonia xyli subsp. cynodontis DSM 46306 TaxID=1389489 RepID=U3P321_LEIXC|nr:UDP-N-acetylglucosamine 2-epimerase (non-hydrolyzing) [Leifsonia xyli]AGW40715.1 O-antigen biosynthesis protein [Leifsonia xyli subsp. cynodontis DSM 46306]